VKVLVTGAGGFVGRYLANELVKAGLEPILTSEESGSVTVMGSQKLPILKCNILDQGALKQIFCAFQPDAIVHLAAISHVVDAQNDRELLSKVNVVGTHNICTAARNSERPLKFLFVSSSLVYGSYLENAISEVALPAPNSAYGASKLAGEYVVRSFSNDRFQPIIVRPFNHIGVGQNDTFVCPSIAKKIAGANHGETIKGGNLNSYRDFTDVRDVVRAYRLILQKKLDEDLFVIGSGKPTKIADIFNFLVSLSGKSLIPKTEVSLLRNIEPLKSYADTSRIAKSIGWKAEVELETSLTELFNAQ
jgi:GDP-4-dehydro-6-deoxy-D-mannose reductase